MDAGISGIHGFTRRDVPTNGTSLSVHRAGQGTPLVLLHGYPQNHMCWHKIAPALARSFDVIIPDLRGYGRSEIPVNDPDNLAYSKREMARDIVGMMDVLNVDAAHVLGHDRGARVAYRFALDHPQRLRRLGIIEIIPTGDFWAAWDADLAMKGYHWTFLAQPAPLPERMICADPRGYIEWTLASWTHRGDLSAFSPDALAAYRAQALDARRISAMCNDYRAGATFDRALDLADRARGAQIAAPLRFLWAKGGFPARSGDPLKAWRAWAPDVSGTEIDRCGHFAMEERPDAVLAAMEPFFKDENT